MKQTILFTLILLLSACGTNNKKSVAPKVEKINVNYSDKLSQLTIKEVQLLNEKHTSSVNDESVIIKKSDCATLREIIDMTCIDSKAYVNIENKAFAKKYFDFSISNYSPKEIRDSVIIHLLSSQLGLTVNTKKIPVGYVKITIADQEKFNSFVNEEQGDTINKRRSVSKLYYTYKNTPLNKITADMSEHFNKIISFEEKGNPRINFQFRANHWGETAKDLQDKLGLKLTTTTVFKTQYTIQ